MKKGHLRALPTHTCAVQQNRRTRQQRQIQLQPRACQCNKYKTFRMLPNTALRCNALRRKHITQLERRPNLKCRRPPNPTPTQANDVLSETNPTMVVPSPLELLSHKRKTLHMPPYALPP